MTASIIFGITEASSIVGGILSRTFPSTIFLIVPLRIFPLLVFGSLSRIKQLLNEATGPKKGN